MSSTAKNVTSLIRAAPKNRFATIQRPYDADQVLRLRGSLTMEYTLATTGANKLWAYLQNEPYVPALGCLTGNQAVQCVKAGLKAIYLSGWQVAADANVSGDMYPDQSLYPANSGPELAKRINKALMRADQIDSAEGKKDTDWFQPIVADAEAGFGGMLNCYELTKSYIEAGAAGIHFEDQLGAEKKCGHMGGKVLIPTAQHVRHLNSARLAADVCGVPTVLVARTDAESARLLTSDIDERDHPYIDHQAGRTREGFFRLKDDGLNHSIMRAIQFAPYADLIWMETSTPDVKAAQKFAEAVRSVHPNQLLAYNCSPSFNWGAKLSPKQMEEFQREIGAMGYKFQFITLAGFHVNNYGMFTLADEYRQHGMAAYNVLQQQEFAAESKGYTAVKHQREVGAGFFDLVAQTAAGGEVSTGALSGSTEQHQFQGVQKRAMSTRPAATELVLRAQPENEQQAAVLSDDARSFLVALHRRFNGRRLKLLQDRTELQQRIDTGAARIDFLPETADIRCDDSWRVREAPADLRDRRVEITGPPDRKMTINAMNCGASVFMADFEDSNTPTWHNQMEGFVNMRDAVRRRISLQQGDKRYALVDKPAVLQVRPRGWHMDEAHATVDGQPLSGSLFDFGLNAFHNARELQNRGSGAYFYFPKLQHWKEAELWNDVVNFTEDEMGLSRGSIRCTVLIEHLLAAFQTEEILHALKDHIVGLNCGRWDYIFSYIKVHRASKQHVVTDRFKIGMTTPLMRAYSLQTIKTCHARGAHAMGGMAANIPIKSDATANEAALEAVKQDKLRECRDGHDGTWVAHPGLVPLARGVFDEYMPAPNQLQRAVDDVITREQLLAVPAGPIDARGFEHNIDVALGYMSAWLNGRGCVPLYNLMEDAATAEISRAQLWQLHAHQCQLQDGTPINADLIQQAIERSVQREINSGSEHANRMQCAGDLLLEFSTAPQLDEFLTTKCYNQLVAEGK